MLTDALLRKYGVRERVKLIASGKLATPDEIAVALGMGADLIHIARGFMISVGCIQALRCHSNECPVGVATTDPKLQRALVVEEKEYRVTNYVLALRKGLFRLAAAAGLESPVEFGHRHVVYKDERADDFPGGDRPHMDGGWKNRRCGGRELMNKQASAGPERSDTAEVFFGSPFQRIIPQASRFRPPSGSW